MPALASEPPGVSPDRVVALDIVKGIAICLVVAGHVIQGLQAGQIASREGGLAEISLWIYRFHMHAFFFASGAVLALRPPPTFLDLARRRAGTLYYPHLLWGVLFYLSAIALTRFYNSPIQDPFDVGRHAFEIAIGQKSWFLPTLFVVTLAIWPLLKKWPLVALLLVLAIAITPWHSMLSVFSYFLRFAFFFALGFVAIGWLRAVVARLPTTALTAAGAIMLAAVFPYQLASDASGISLRVRDLGFGIVGVAGLWSAASALARMEKLASALAWLGHASLAIFLMHPFATGAARAAMLSFVSRDQPWTYFIVIGVLGIALPALAYALAPRLRLQWLFAWPKKRARNADQANPAR